MISLAYNIMAFFIFVAIYGLSYWICFIHIVPEALAPLDALLALLTGFFAARFVRRKMDGREKGILTAIAMGAVICGAIGFAGGFFGPMVFAPGANQGPMLGIFITGPLGFIGGGVLGAAWWLIWGRHRG